MSSWAPGRFWKLSLLCALAFLVIDSRARLLKVYALTDADAAPVVQAAQNDPTPTGKTDRQHTVVLGTLGNDPYQWIKTTEQLVEGTPRVHHVDFDGPPGGREAHWSSLLRWWAAVLAWGYGLSHGLSTTASVEWVSPWANTILLVFLLLGTVPIVACRFGSIPAGVFAIGFVSAAPFYLTYAVGNFDHHGLAAFTSTLTVLFAIAGGAGLVKRDTRAEDDAAPIARWLPDPTSAQRWFIASGVAGGIGLWISAATQIATLVATGAAAVCVALMCRRDSRVWVIRPGVWRTWGMSGAATSVLFYLLEYFPSNFRLHLEVNHPLFALAWVGAGDLLARIASLAGSSDSWPTSFAGCAKMRLMAIGIGTDLLMMGVAPMVAWRIPDSFIPRGGSFVMAIHKVATTEIRSTFSELGLWSWNSLDSTVGVLFPALLLAPVAVVACSRRASPPARVLVAFATVGATLLTLLALGQVRWWGSACGLWVVVLAVLSFVLRAEAPFAAVLSAKEVRWGVLAMLPMVVLPTLLTTARNVVQQNGNRSVSVRVAETLLPWGQWVSIAACTVVLGASLLVATGMGRKWNRVRLASGGIVAGVLLAAWPAATLTRLSLTHGVPPIIASDFGEVMARDLARKLRARLGDERGVVAGEPTLTMQLIYFGGMRGIGTYMWENAPGLMASTELLGAGPTATQSAADVALAKAKELGVTHIVVASWQPFLREYAAIAREYVANSRRARSDDELFGPQLLNGDIPTWLRPLPYRLPQINGLEREWMWVFEVVPSQSRDEALTRLAQFADALGDKAGAVAQLNDALRARADCEPALIALARLQFDHPERGDFQQTLKQIRRHEQLDSLAAEDLISLATVYMLVQDSVSAKRVMSRTLATANETTIRRLPWGTASANFVLLSRQLGLSDRNPRLMDVALAGMDPAIRAQVERTSSR